MPTLILLRQEDIAPAALLKKPNPRNVQNALKLQELELEAKRFVVSRPAPCNAVLTMVRLREEKASWDSVMSTTASTISKEATADEAQNNSMSAVDPTFLTEQDAALLHSLTTHSNIVETAVSRFQHSTSGLELHIDSLADGIHRLKKLTEAVDEVTDRVHIEASSALQRRDQAALEKAGTEKVGVGDILRSLARVG